MSRSGMSPLLVSELQKDAMHVELRRLAPSLAFAFEPTTILVMRVTNGVQAIGEVNNIHTQNGYDLDAVIAALDQLEDDVYRNNSARRRCPADLRKARDFVSQLIARRGAALANGTTPAAPTP